MSSLQQTDNIQSAIAERAKSLDLTAYAIARDAASEFGEDAPSEDTVRRYLLGKCALNSRHVSRLCYLLDLELRPLPKSRSRTR